MLQTEARLLQEAELLHNLRHRNIIQLRAACIDPPTFCLVLEYAENGTLSKYIADTLEPARILDWSLQIAKVRTAGDGGGKRAGRRQM